MKPQNWEARSRGDNKAVGNQKLSQIPTFAFDLFVIVLYFVISGSNPFVRFHQGEEKMLIGVAILGTIRDLRGSIVEIEFIESDRKSKAKCLNIWKL